MHQKAPLKKPRRHQVVAIYLTPEEKEILTKKAMASGRQDSPFVRRSLVQAGVLPPRKGEVFPQANGTHASAN